MYPTPVVHTHPAAPRASLQAASMCEASTTLLFTSPVCTLLQHPSACVCFSLCAQCWSPSEAPLSHPWAACFSLLFLTGLPVLTALCCINLIPILGFQTVCKLEQAKMASFSSPMLGRGYSTNNSN